MNLRDIQQKQLTQIIEYAEIDYRINHLLEMLEPDGGYMGEKDIYQQLKQVQKNIRKEIMQHLKNAEINKRAMTLINNMIVCPRVFKENIE